MQSNQFLPEPRFWDRKKVLITGHTGFKGSWLTLWLNLLGAEVKGYSLAPDSGRMFDCLNLEHRCQSVVGNIMDLPKLRDAISSFGPEVVFHVAAQPLVIESYREPLDTFAVNALGTANVLEACRTAGDVRAIVVVTTDKVYDNKEVAWSFRETDPLGGNDPYSASKACAELISNSYRRSFFDQAGTALATVRAGNVFGGGDWSENRLIPDAVQAFYQRKPLVLRNPAAVRPWQFVLEPLCGYLMVARACLESKGFSVAWNFGPNEGEIYTVARLAEALAKAWGDEASTVVEGSAVAPPKEAGSIVLNSGYAMRRLGWRPVLAMEKALEMTIDWYKCFYQKKKPEQIISLTERQIQEVNRLYLRGEELCVI